LIYWLIQDREIDPQDILNFSELYWPAFLRKDKYIFLKEQFSEEKYDEIVKESENPEYWMNLVTIDEFFSELPDGQDRAIFLAKILVEVWGAKLKKDFPGMNFSVKWLWNQEYGDCGLTFYQLNEERSSQEASCSNEISSPNIKENEIIQSSTGLRLGLPKIRKARPDEIPK